MNSWTDLLDAVFQLAEAYPILGVIVTLMAVISLASFLFYWIKTASGVGGADLDDPLADAFRDDYARYDD